MEDENQTRNKTVVNYTQTKILVTLLQFENKKNQHVTPTVLTKKIGLKTSNVSFELNNLNDGGYLEFYKDQEKDARARFIRLTKFGKTWAWYLKIQNIIPFLPPVDPRDESLEEIINFFSKGHKKLNKNTGDEEND